ncbi:cytochrome P450 6A1-like [Megalopta genalis]|uniref:cytochrome P450 6A1-like n=1 Tax=Megalopta genalis TaxID=115081 RepID=UPI003FD66857
MADYLQLFCGIALVFVAVYYYLISSFDFWICRGVPGPDPISVFGNTKDILFGRLQVGVFLRRLYEKYKNEPLIGIFIRRSPNVVVCDMDLIKDVLIKDFSVFDDRGIVFNEKVEPLAQHMFNLEAERWRPLRTRLSPVFTFGEVKQLFHLIMECSEQLEKYLEKLEEKGEPIECREVAARFTTDVIGSCAFGINMNALSNEESEFRRMGKMAFSTSLKNFLKLPFRESLPKLYFFMMSLRPYPYITSFFIRVVSDTIKYREENNVIRPDFVNMLIELKNHPEKLQDVEITDNLLTAQAFGFFLGGFETSSITICHALYEMALNPQMQDKLRAEIKALSKKNNGSFQHDDLKEMKYLDKVFKETLRKYPPGTVLMRKCNREYTFRNTKVTIPKGTGISIPVYALHHDPSIYPNPEVFDPERFNDDAVAARHPMSFLPFGDGPRNCIAARFGTYQTKVGLIKTLENFNFSVCERTMIPYECDPRSIIYSPKRGIYLKISKVKQCAET